MINLNYCWYFNANQTLINFQYAIFLGILLVLEMTATVLGFVFKDWVSKFKYEAFCTNPSSDLLHYGTCTTHVTVYK
jgi:hypothetical protein